MSRVLDRAGQRFGRLVVLSEAGRDKQGRATWLCRCDCGTEKVIPSRHLGSGSVVSCGCYNRETAAESGRKSAYKISGCLSPRWKSSVSYSAAHQRVRAARGSAQNYCCADCGDWAKHWSYDLADPDELIENGLRYSLRIDRYVPRCVRCHSAHDNLKEGASWYLGREIERRKNKLGT